MMTFSGATLHQSIRGEMGKFYPYESKNLLSESKNLLRAIFKNTKRYR